MNTDHYKELLLAEKSKLEEELSGLGHKSGDDWVADGEQQESNEADPLDQADHAEEYENRVAVLSTLEARLAEVTAALDRIETGTYGVDADTGEPIDPARLEANPAATNNL